MPLTKKGNTILGAMQKEYGAEDGKRVFYASVNKGKVKGADPRLDRARQRRDAARTVLSR